jgi:tetratricopeptide (TPR) repeat protein
VILDDVTDYEQIKPYLPPQESRFKLLATTRLNLGRSFQSLEIQVLSEDAALDLLRSGTAARSPARSLTEVDRINSQLETAKPLCAWLGYLPLGLELVGRYLAQKPDLSLADLQKRLEAQRLKARALTQVEAGMTAPLGVATAFELSWQELDKEAQRLCYLLSLFALAPIAWNWVEPCFPDRDPEDLEDLRDRLVRSSLMQRSGEGTYILHQLIRKFFQAKAIEFANQDEMNELKRSICRVMADISRTVPETITLTDVARLSPVIPHLESIAHHLISFYTDENLIWLFLGVVRFYIHQGLNKQAEPWYCECVRVTTERLGQDHLDVATSLNNLAELRHFQGRDAEAESLCLRSLDIRERQLGRDHLDVATCLNNLALVYESQRRDAEAESSYLRALDIREEKLGRSHLYVATILNNLALFYRSQGRYSEAKPFLLRSLAIKKKCLGQDHPSVANSLNSLAALYQSQERYAEAKPLYLRSLQIFEHKLGLDHPSTVAIPSESYASEHLPIGQVGTIVEIYEAQEPRYLVEFADLQGREYAMAVLQADEFIVLRYQLEGIAAS